MRYPASVLAAALLLAACGSAPPDASHDDPEGRYPITGTVLAQPGDTSVTLAHEAVDGYMPAMTMEFRGEALPALAAGDRVSATLLVTGDRSSLTDVVVIGRASGFPTGDGGSASAPLRVASLGEVMPDVTLTNQDGRILPSSAFRGRVLLVNFIYTRCPLPEFCPRLMAQFEAFRQAVSDDELRGSIHFLSVTMDPDHDTPPMLRAYGERAITGPGRFDQWDLVTGDEAALRQLAAFAGVAYRSVEGWIEHSMETVIVGADGRLIRRFATGAWDHEEALAIATREAKRVQPF